MRLVQVMVPTGKRETILEVLDDEGIDYVVTDETSGREYTAIVSFPLPTAAVEPVLERLRDAGVERESYTVVINAETVASKKFEKLRERYEKDEDISPDRIAREELAARAQDLAPTLSTYLLMTIVSVVIATAGILLDSPAVVVGSMVIAPLIGPAMATAAGSVIDDHHMFVRGLKLQFIGFAIAIAAAAVFAWFVKTVHFVPPGMDPTTIEQVSSRLTPDFLSLAIALGAGIAGAMSLRSGVSAPLVGVMIAVALVPPTAVIGVGIAWGLPEVVFGASLLVGVNVLSINLAAMSTLWYSGYRPDDWFRRDQARSATLSRIGVLVVAIVVLSVFLGGATYVSYATALSDEGVCDDVTSVLGDEVYEDAHLLRVETVDDGRVWQYPPDTSPNAVIVHVSVPPNESYPEIATAIQAAVADEVSDVRVAVRFVETRNAPRSNGSIVGSAGDGALTCEGSTRSERVRAPRPHASIGPAVAAAGR